MLEDATGDALLVIESHAVALMICDCVVSKAEHTCKSLRGVDLVLTLLCGIHDLAQLGDGTTGLGRGFNDPRLPDNI